MLFTKLTETCSKSCPSSCELATTSLSAIHCMRSSISWLSLYSLRTSSNFARLSWAKSLRPAYSLSTCDWRTAIWSLKTHKQIWTFRFMQKLFWIFKLSLCIFVKTALMLPNFQVRVGNSSGNVQYNDLLIADCCFAQIADMEIICGASSEFDLEHSIMTNFNCAYPAIQRGQGSGFLSEGSSWLTACMSEQQRFWRDCVDVQAHLNLCCSHRQ